MILLEGMGFDDSNKEELFLFFFNFVPLKFLVVPTSNKLISC